MTGDGGAGALPAQQEIFAAAALPAPAARVRQLPLPAMPAARAQQRNGRRGYNFCVRVTDDERRALEAKHARSEGPRGLGPWLVWRALEGEQPKGNAGPRRDVFARAGNAGARCTRAVAATRTILDLCAGTGSWSQPYVDAGYKFLRVTLPHFDVRTFPGADAERELLESLPPVHGILCAPPCNEFSLAKNGHVGARDMLRGMECVNACMRIVAQLRPRWWVLENPVGYLRRFLGEPRDVFEPHYFGDPWTKRTALWGDFNLPRRGPYVEPTSSAMDRSTAEARATTPPGFARAFFEANP